MNIEEIKEMDFYDFCGIHSVFLTKLEDKIKYIESLGITVTK